MNKIKKNLKNIMLIIKKKYTKQEKIIMKNKKKKLNANFVNV